MAAKAGWICSAGTGSSGSASSLRSIRCVRALSQYTPSPDLLSNRSSTTWLSSITIITVQLLTDAGLLQVHVFTVNLPHIPTYTRRNGARFLPQVYRNDTSVCPTNHIDFGDNFNFGELVCRRI